MQKAEEGHGCRNLVIAPGIFIQKKLSSIFIWIILVFSPEWFELGLWVLIDNLLSPWNMLERTHLLSISFIHKLEALRRKDEQSGEMWQLQNWPKSSWVKVHFCCEAIFTGQEVKELLSSSLKWWNRKVPAVNYHYYIFKTGFSRPESMVCHFDQENILSKIVIWTVPPVFLDTQRSRRPIERERG